jgi:hypothetical protein
MDTDVVARARDACYTAVGFGVLAVQRLQVARRQLTKDLVRQAEAVVDPVLDGVERQLPQPARAFFHQVRVTGRAVRRTVLPT